MMTNRRVGSLPIADVTVFDWEDIRRIPIRENSEPLVPASLLPEHILTLPQYYLDNLPGALPECYVRQGVLKRLVKAARMLPKGYKLVILDSFRPVQVQQYLYDSLAEALSRKYPEKSQEELENMVSSYVALPSQDPDAPSPHSTGGAVDLTIVDPDGELLDMGTAFDDCSARSATLYYEACMDRGDTLDSAGMEAAMNRRLLYHVMIQAGFSNYFEEWWHYAYGDQVWAGTAAGLEERKAVYGRAYLNSPWC